MKILKNLIIILFVTVLFNSCSSDDNNDDNDDTNNECSSYTDQIAKGNFKGRDFVVTGGAFKALGDEQLCKIYISEPIDDNCFFAHFGGDEGQIIFSLPNLDAQTITFSATGSDTLNFNSNENNEVEFELSECGKMEIFENDGVTVTGRVIAKGLEGSTIDGNFTIQLCD